MSREREGEGAKFRSFKDLRRSRGGEEPAPPPPAPDSVSEFVEDYGDSALAETSRERIARRPRAFGPMPHGPLPYRDTDGEEMQILASFRVRTVFPKDVLAELGSLPSDPSPAEFVGRQDLRGELIYTIDGEDAKDYDDAISIKELGGGEVEVGVHIADVAHYVVPGTALDAEALARGTSVYLADQVVPMLPEELSNTLCSLVGGRPRLAYSVHMVFDDKGQRVSARVAKSVIQSVRRNTYKEVQELLDGQDTPGARALAPLAASLKLFQKWTHKQQQLRDAKGSMRIASVEKKVLFDEQHEVRAIVDAPRYFSMTLIEETALAANQAVGDLFRERGLPTIYRVHPEKDPEEIEKVAIALEEHGLRVPKKDRLTGRDIARLIQAARKKPNAEALIQRIMGLVERAVYEVKDEKDVATHFGLARKAYLHFTSPIRRYPDLMVHRWLWAIESRGAEAERELKMEELVHDLTEVAAHCSMQADVAEMAETAIFDLKICQFLHPHIGEKIDAVIVRVSPPGMEVRLVPFNVTGFLPSRAIGERAEVKGPNLVIRAGRRSLSFSEGHPVRVKIQDVDFMRLSVMLELG
ncbi:MAG: VacB/RNase II family 3'-5' exoribonuclease [Planctomycetes bacterium]|nr:VacB/RNase II family 3'-5' exoribonuclease [Planctomycetota bacterium]